MPLHESGILRLAPPSFNRIAVAWREKPGSQHRSHQVLEFENVIFV